MPSVEAGIKWRIIHHLVRALCLKPVLQLCIKESDLHALHLLLPYRQIGEDPVYETAYETWRHTQLSPCKWGPQAWSLNVHWMCFLRDEDHSGLLPAAGITTRVQKMLKQPGDDWTVCAALSLNTPQIQRLCAIDHNWDPTNNRHFHPILHHF